MKAVVMPGDGTVTIVQRELPEPGPLDALVRATALSFCSADLIRLGRPWWELEGRPPGGEVTQDTIVGHEAVGVVERVGGLVVRVAPGDRVALTVTSACGRCPNCQRGKHSQCGGELGSYRFAVTRDGLMAEYFVAPEADFNLARIPDAVPDEQAVLVSDTISTGFAGAERGEIPLGGAVAVFGQGHIGLGATAGARLVGAGLVIAVKARPRRFELSRAVGADVVLATGERDPVAAIMELTNGDGVDTAIVAAGSDDALIAAVKATRPGGVISDITSYRQTGPEFLRLPTREWGWGLADKKLVSTLCPPGGERIGRFLRLIENGRVDLSPMVTHRYSGFEEIPRAFADAIADEEFCKAVVRVAPG